MAKSKGKQQRAVFQIMFPVERGTKLQPVVNTLRFWNTHYKAMHEWQDGRVEVVFDRRVKGYDKPECKMLDFSCPYCDKRLYYKPDAVHGVKGNICCSFCRKKFGIHPSGQLFVVRSVERKVATTTLVQDKVAKWVQGSTTYLDATVLPTRVGDAGVEVELEYREHEDAGEVDAGLSEFVQALEESGFSYRRLS